MADLILHHYPGSLFAEKIRAILGYKGLAWHSVETSPIMPRDELMPLTGGYRRIPVLQIGADVFCDTHAITEALDAHAPERSLVPPALGAAARLIAARADTHLFQVGVAICFQPRAIAAVVAAMGEEMMAKFAADRARLVEGSAGVSTMAPEVAEACLADELARLDAQLAHGDWLLGTGPTLADFAVYHCLWFVAGNPVVAPLLDPWARVKAWMARIADFGHGDARGLSAEEALEIGRAATPMAIDEAASCLPEGLALGDAVTVTPVDYGLVPVAGTLERCTEHLCAVGRDDPRAGRVRVHFPRTGFRIDAA